MVKPLLNTLNPQHIHKSAIYYARIALHRPSLPYSAADLDTALGART